MQTLKAPGSPGLAFQPLSASGEVTEGKIPISVREIEEQRKQRKRGVYRINANLLFRCVMLLSPERVRSALRLDGVCKPHACCEPLPSRSSEILLNCLGCNIASPELTRQRGRVMLNATGAMLVQETNST